MVSWSYWSKNFKKVYVDKHTIITEYLKMFGVVKKNFKLCPVYTQNM